MKTRKLEYEQEKLLNSGRRFAGAMGIIGFVLFNLPLLSYEPKAAADPVYLYERPFSGWGVLMEAVRKTGLFSMIDFSLIWYGLYLAAAAFVLAVLLSRRRLVCGILSAGLFALSCTAFILFGVRSGNAGVFRLRFSLFGTPAVFLLASLVMLICYFRGRALRNRIQEEEEQS